jgi:hypothetical protein
MIIKLAVVKKEMTVISWKGFPYILKWIEEIRAIEIYLHACIAPRYPELLYNS